MTPIMAAYEDGRIELVHPTQLGLPEPCNTVLAAGLDETEIKVPGIQESPAALFHREIEWALRRWAMTWLTTPEDGPRTVQEYFDRAQSLKETGRRRPNWGIIQTTRTGRALMQQVHSLVVDLADQYSFDFLMEQQRDGLVDFELVPRSASRLGFIIRFLAGGCDLFVSALGLDSEAIELTSHDHREITSLVRSAARGEATVTTFRTIRGRRIEALKWDTGESFFPRSLIRGSATEIRCAPWERL